MKRPTVRDLDAASARDLAFVAERLRGAGHRAWLVGGAVRDLALGRRPSDFDIATAARPEELERLFERTASVGRAFGTVVVVLPEREIQVTTYRSERGYSDGRRPDAVEFGATAEEDARRRDFTCNALFLDPLSDELLDPEKGLADLERGLLRCIGDARARFREDGLRLVRMARLAAANELAIAADTWSAALAELDALRGVSAERVLDELEKVLAKPHAARAVELMATSGIVDRAVRGLREIDPLDPTFAARCSALKELGAVAGTPAGLAVLFDASRGRGGEGERERAVFATLKPSRSQLDELRAVQGVLASISSVPNDARRSVRIRIVREPVWPLALRVARAWRRSLGEDTRTLDELESFAASLAPGELRPTPWITSADLAAAGIERGPRWGSLLREAETLQLDGAWRSRDEALEWLARQVGGNT